MMKWFLGRVSHYPYAVLVGMLPVIAMAGYFTQQVGVDNNIRIWFASDDPALQQYDALLQRFGRDVVVSVVFQGDALFTEEKMRSLEDASRKIREKTAWFEDALSIGDVYVSWKQSREEIAAASGEALSLGVEDFKASVLDSELYRGLVVSADGRHVSLNFTLTEEGNRRHRADALQLVRDLADRIAEGAPYDMVGQPVHGAELDRLSLYVKKLYVGIIGIACVLLLYLCHSLALAIIGTLSVAATLMLTQTYLFFRGFDLNVITSALPALLIVISLSNVIHVVVEFRQRLEKHGMALRALHEVAHHIAWPCFFNALTTAVGFVSLLSSAMQPIRQLGELACIGVMGAYFLCLTITTAGISVLHRGFEHRHQAGKGTLPESRFFGWLADFVSNHRRDILYVTIVLTVWGAWSASRLKVESNPMEFFPEGSEFRKSYARVEGEFTGLSPFSIEIKSKTSMLEPANLRKLELIQHFIATDPELKDRVKGTTSPADFIKEANRMARGGGPFNSFVPADREILQKILDKMPDRLKNQLRNRFLADEGKTARIAVRARTLSSTEYEILLARVEEWIGKTFGGEIEAANIGIVPLINNTQHSILWSQIQSFSLAIGVIGFIFLLLVRNLFTCVVYMVVCALPILVTMGAMYWLGISLNASTTMIASVALGIAIDDLIHFHYRYREGLKTLGKRHAAIRFTLQGSGRAIWFTSVINVIGFSLLFFSGFMPTIYFGGLLALTMLIAVIGCLVLLPSKILLFHVDGRECEVPTPPPSGMES